MSAPIIGIWVGSEYAKNDTGRRHVVASRVEAGGVQLRKPYVLQNVSSVGIDPFPSTGRSLAWLVIDALLIDSSMPYATKIAAPGRCQLAPSRHGG